ncbi:MAG: hypothetical protein JNJ45_09890 [Chthonomonas sp.]|nr:hypothetical protein [Chthonomonas sp.]
MKPTCWLSYLDGTMPAADRARIDEQLANDPALRDELAGYQQCCQAIGSCCQGDSVPLDRLRAQCQFKNQPMPARKRWGLGLVLAGAATCVVAGVLIAPSMFGRSDQPGAGDPNLFAQGPVVGQLVVSNPNAAADYARQQTNFDVPVMTVGQIQKVECGKEWACMDLLVEGEKVRVYMRPGLDCDFTAGKSMKLPCGTVVYCCQGTGWQTKGYSFYAVGGSESTRMELASLTRSSLANWTPRLQ